MEKRGAPRVQVESRAGSRDGIRVLTVNGSLTALNFYHFQEACRSAVALLLIIDLSGVPFMDSTALGCLLTVHISRERSGLRYALVGVPNRLLSMFAICGVQGVLNIFPAVADAEAALQQRGG